MKTSIDLIKEDKYLQHLHECMSDIYDKSEVKLVVKNGKVEYIYPKQTKNLINNVKELIHNRLIQLTT